jgi:hypothetical protein
MTAAAAQATIAAAAAYLAAEAPAAGLLADLDSVLLTACAAHGFEFDAALGEAGEASEERAEEAEADAAYEELMRSDDEEGEEEEEGDRLVPRRYGALRAATGTQGLGGEAGTATSLGSRLTAAANAGWRAAGYSNGLSFGAAAAPPSRSSGWFPVLDQASGRTYFVDAKTNQARWDPPPGA